MFVWGISLGSLSCVSAFSNDTDTSLRPLFKNMIPLITRLNTRKQSLNENR